MIGFDEVGAPFAIEESPLADGEHRGIRGIRVQEASPTWQHDSYFFNQTKQDTTKALQPLGVAGTPYWVDSTPADVDPEEAAAIAAVNTQDLKERGLTPNDYPN
jgi:hypothetical protein